MAVDDNYIRSNPSNNVLKELKQSHIFKTEKRRGLTKPEQELLLNYLKTHRIYNHWYPIFAVMIGTGMRVGEVAGLRWRDIDLDEGIIDVNQTLVYYDHREPDGKKGCYFNVHSSGIATMKCCKRERKTRLCCRISVATRYATHL